MLETYGTLTKFSDEESEFLHCQNNKLALRASSHGGSKDVSAKVNFNRSEIRQLLLNPLRRIYLCANKEEIECIDKKDMFEDLDEDLEEENEESEMEIRNKKDHLKLNEYLGEV